MRVRARACVDGESARARVFFALFLYACFSISSTTTTTRAPLLSCRLVLPLERAAAAAARQVVCVSVLSSAVHHLLFAADVSVGGARVLPHAAHVCVLSGQRSTRA